MENIKVKTKRGKTKGEKYRKVHIAHVRNVFGISGEERKKENGTKAILNEVIAKIFQNCPASTRHRFKNVQAGSIYMKPHF